MNFGKKILVIDDEEIVRELLTEVISDSGFQVEVAENGMKGLEIYSQHDNVFDLVIIDMSMPGMSGLEVCQKMLGINPSQKIIIATGSYTTDEDISQLNKCGISHVMNKPFNLSELTILLQRELA